MCLCQSQPKTPVTPRNIEAPPPPTMSPTWEFHMLCAFPTRLASERFPGVARVGTLAQSGDSLAKAPFAQQQALWWRHESFQFDYRLPGRIREILGGSTLLWSIRTTASNALMRLCLLRWQDERVSPTFPLTHLAPTYCPRLSQTSVWATFATHAPWYDASLPLRVR